MNVLIRKYPYIFCSILIFFAPVVTQAITMPTPTSAPLEEYAYLNFHAVVEATTCDISLDKTEVETTINKSVLAAVGPNNVYPLDILELTLNNCTGLIDAGKNVMVGFSGQVADTDRTFRAADSKNVKLSAVFNFTDQFTAPNIAHCNQGNVINYNNLTANLLPWPVTPAPSGELHSLNDSKAKLFTGICVPPDGDSGNGQFHAALDITLFFI